MPNTKKIRLSVSKTCSVSYVDEIHFHVDPSYVWNLAAQTLQWNFTHMSCMCGFMCCLFSFYALVGDVLIFLSVFFPWLASLLQFGIMSMALI